VLRPSPADDASPSPVCFGAPQRHFFPRFWPHPKEAPVSDTWTILLAAAVSVGAWLVLPVPVWFGALVVLVALVVRRPALLCVGGALLAGGLSVAAWAGTAPPRSAPFAGVVTLVRDPESTAGAVRVQVRARGHRYEAWARGAPGATLERAQAGERLELSGRLGAAPAGQRRRLAEEHVIGQLQVERAEAYDGGNVASAAANRIRRTLDAGAWPLSPGERALFTGFVLGDDRAESPDLIADFRASGLSHLTAVSGENLAFVMALAGPVLRRLGLRSRYVVTLGLVAWFALLTRFEPSVLRAAAMAAVAATSVVLARPASTIRMLALAVAAMTLIDPLLVWSVGWWLSVGATAGIALLGPTLSARLPGPRPLSDAIAVTIAAQVGVAPILVATFGGVPVVAVPANMLAAPVAGPLMVWGLPAGIIAGLVPELAPGLHVPTRLAVRWIALVARVGAAAPVGQLGTASLLGLASVIGTVAAARAVWPRRRDRAPP
jgi:competence protein ComEC